LPLSWRACKSLIPDLLLGACLCVAAGSLAAQDLVPLRATAGKQVTSVDFGPFKVASTMRVVLAGLTDSRSPAAFLAPLRQYPQIRRSAFSSYGIVGELSMTAPIFASGGS